MKTLVTILFLYCANLNAQHNLQFDKRFVESENKWVAFQQGSDGAFSYGYIYIDAQAGLTLNYEGKFKITSEGKFVPSKMDSANVKYRLEANQVKVAFIPEEKFVELKVDAVPDWLKYYYTDTNSIERLHRWGFLYNSWNECRKALTYLERAQQVAPDFKGLAFELAFAYNALEQFDKALLVLAPAIKKNPKECYLYKERSFAEMHLNQLDQAAETCKIGISTCEDKAMKSEIAYNLAYEYFKNKDKGNFKRWARETKKWATAGDQFMQNIHAMEAEISK